MAASDATPSFVWPVRVYWEDTDAGGIVYYANYLKFMERARTEWLRAHRHRPGRACKEEHGLMFVVVDVEAHYPQAGALRRPAAGDAAGCARRTRRQPDVRRRRSIATPSAASCCSTGSVRVACLDAQTYRPRPLPQELWKQINAGDR